MTVYTEQNKPVCSFKDTVYRSGPVIFEWNGMAGKNNSAGIPITDYVPAGKYHIEVSASANILNEKITENAKRDVLVLNKTKAASYGTDYKNMSPIYTGDYRVDYMTKTILDSIINPKMTNYQKIEEVYLWILKNCAHDETKCIHCVNGWNFFDKNKIETEGKKFYKEYYNKFLRGEADILLSGLSSHNYPYLYYGDENGETLYSSLKINELSSSNMFYEMKTEYILEHRTAICSYFASLFRTMVNQLGFKSDVVIGKYINTNGKQYEHYWNYVVINGNYYWIDTDIDCILYRSSRKFSYQNFLKKDSDKSWIAHHIWDAKTYPACK